MEILLGRPQDVDSGSGTTITKQYDLLRLQDVAVRTFNLHGSENVSIHHLRAYQQLTNTVARKVDRARVDLRSRVFQGESGQHKFDWKVNPIHHVGEGPDGLYTTSPYVEGLSLGELFNNRIDVLNALDPKLAGFLRQEFSRFGKLLNYEFPYQHLRLIALNVTMTNLRGSDHQLVITNLREYVDPRGNPFKLLRR